MPPLPLDGAVVGLAAKLAHSKSMPMWNSPSVIKLEATNHGRERPKGHCEEFFRCHPINKAASLRFNDVELRLLRTISTVEPNQHNLKKHYSILARRVRMFYHLRLDQGVIRHILHSNAGLDR